MIHKLLFHIIEEFKSVSRLDVPRPGGHEDATTIVKLCNKLNDL